MAKTKFGNKPFWLNTLTGTKAEVIPKNSNHDLWEHWDSELEWRVHQELLKKYPSQFIERQSTQLLLPPSRHFPVLTWCCDFKLSLPILPVNSADILIEAKGRWILSEGEFKHSFRRLLQTLAFTNPLQYERTIVVDNSPWKLCREIKVIGIKDLHSEILKLLPIEYKPRS